MNKTLQKAATRGLGIAAGFAIYDYFSNGVIDWQRSIIIAIFSAGIAYLIERFKNK